MAYIEASFSPLKDGHGIPVRGVACRGRGLGGGLWEQVARQVQYIYIYIYKVYRDIYNSCKGCVLVCIV